MAVKKPFAVKMTDEEKAQIRKRANEAHLSMTRFLILQGLYGEFIKNDGQKRE